VREGTFVGTPLYVAPEMLDGNFAGRFTDLWALGCIIYQFHVGHTPFQGKSYDSVF
jgi:3-phosphoinositide dependent protein kinase-1